MANQPPACAATKVHQIFLDVGLGSLESHVVYMRNMELVQKWAAEQGFAYKLWRDGDIEHLVDRSSAYHGVIKQFPQPFWLVDFVKLLVLAEADTAGCRALYVDLDETPLQPWQEEHPGVVVG
eukprot:13301812-Heterocapsa_arctica.AAC.1